MSDAVIQGDYVDLRFVKGRKVCQIVIECPIEAGQAIVSAFGTPRPDSTVPVALARLQSGSAPDNPGEPPERRRFDTLKRAQQAGILCNEGGFQKYLEHEKGLTFSKAFAWDTQAATAVRKLCGVNSRADLDTVPNAGKAWDQLVTDYRLWPGYVA